MIHGHIDFVSRARVEGWIASRRVALTGARVLAFVDETCIGGGTVDLFRQDLADAGFGEGKVGFRFPIAPEPWHDTRVLDVRLEGGSLILKQARTCLVSRESVGEDRRRQGRDAASLGWMLARGWIAQTQHDALRTLSEFGVREQRLHFRAPASDTAARCEEAALAAAEILEMHMLQPVELEIREGLRPADLEPLRRELRDAFPHVPPVIGFWAKGETRVQVVEGAHLPGAPLAPGGGLEYSFGGAQLLMLDLDGRYDFAATGGTFAAFVPVRPQA
ncbi:hypothetical protein [Aureimonas psammosilenae]|uniref:hypothetical protein n=1 Tax=Aureimonas psammosilenae TaxID=2495496 RepID=UPI0012607AFF|nr:hypothetical protein [Aureimonas psammosilenae]